MNKRLSILIALSLLVALLVPGAVAAKANKVDLCHLNGNGSYKLISVSEKAVPAHLAHGDVYPGTLVGDGDKYVGDDCSVLQTATVTSAIHNFSSTGAAGWSCPAETPQVLSAYLQDAGTDDDPTVAPHTLYLWVPGATTGAVTYPSTPFNYTYGEGETGAIVLNGVTPQSAQIVLTCVAP